MHYIYKFTNKVNGKNYIGQTNNIEKRKRGHKSEAFNKKSNGYNLPFHAAIRKHGWESFDFEVIEEIPDDFGIEYVNKREEYFIALLDTQINSHKGYNVTFGGDGCAKPKLSFEEQVALSKLFTLEQVKDIQFMLIEGYQYYEILSKYPQLTNSFLSNINNGYNFVRQDLVYPLATLHSKFSKQTQDDIIQAIKQNKSYAAISVKYGISPSYISMINNGSKWHKDEESYPLCKKGGADGAWAHMAKQQLIFTDLSQATIASNCKKSKAAITALNVGRNRKDCRFKYPLRQHQLENQQIWNTLF